MYERNNADFLADQIRDQQDDHEDMDEQIVKPETAQPCIPRDQFFYHLEGLLTLPLPEGEEDAYEPGEGYQSPVGIISSRSTMRITVRFGARVRCRTPRGTTNP